MTPAAPETGLRVALIGATSLKGKEVKQVLEERLFPLRKLALLDDPEALGQLTDFEGEPALVEAIDADTFTENDLVFFASTADRFTRQNWPQAAAGSAAVIDLSHALLDVPEARVRVPFLEDCLPPTDDSPRRWYTVPHAAAIALLAMLGRLNAKLSVRRAVANVFEPVSERGAAGLDELQEQTVRLLSFQSFPRTVFDAQVAFNLLARYGAESASHLEQIDDLVYRQIERRAPKLAERVALRVLQAPVFHAHCLSVLVELEQAAELPAVERALAGRRVSVLRQDESPAGAVDAAGRDEIIIGPVLRDRKRPAAFWLWAVADNLRLTAQTAVDIAETLVS
ncbi:MAG TPA: Asd/ArgC dimerization domain-containing protein [Candidatus Xenobia bacterium]|nr:Asd/ArgC dimerization domain-containing protein [Candidatus Xenobia bacterium]